MLISECMVCITEHEKKDNRSVYQITYFLSTSSKSHCSSPKSLHKGLNCCIGSFSERYTKDFSKTLSDVLFSIVFEFWKHKIHCGWT